MVEFEKTEVLVEEDVAVDELLASIQEENFLVVYNDEVNTFEWVIESFIEICGHSEVQSEQLAYLIHFKGKATVRTGSLDQLKPMKDALCDRGLSAVIE